MASNTTTPATGEGPAFLQKYKAEQGKWTRMGTAVGAGALIAWGAYFFYQQLATFESDNHGVVLAVRVGVPIVFSLICACLTYWLVYANRRSSDFMIATEGEMKKVNWTSKGEIIGSTKVVILFTFLLALLIFFADFMFQQIFQWIGVLKTG